MTTGSYCVTSNRNSFHFPLYRSLTLPSTFEKTCHARLGTLCSALFVMIGFKSKRLPREQAPLSNRDECGSFQVSWLKIQSDREPTCCPLPPPAVSSHTEGEDKIQVLLMVEGRRYVCLLEQRCANWALPL